MNKRERTIESRRMSLVKNYFDRWVWWLLAVVMSVSLSMVYIFNQSNTFFELGTLTRLSLATCWAFATITMALISFPKCGGGLLSISAMFFIVGSLTGFAEPTRFLALTSIIMSIVYLLIEILLGVQFRIDVKVKELLWCPNKAKPSDAKCVNPAPKEDLE